MGDAKKDAVRAFLKELEGAGWDNAQIERIRGHMAPQARYQVYAWEGPIVGRDAIRRELHRLGRHFHDLRCEVVNIASAASTVFVERVDSMMTEKGPLTQHIAAVFEVDDGGRISAWREYYDSKEITTQVGASMTTAGQRAWSEGGPKSI
jgi:limonene-1,2-epoxide hydrolase